MDKLELKNSVVQLRDSGMTFDAISKYLESSFGVQRSRQAVQGLYKRAVAQQTDVFNSGRRQMAMDAINIYILGYNKTEVTNILNAMGTDVKYTAVIDMLADDPIFIEDMRNSKVNMIVKLIDDGASLTDIKDYLTYNGVEPKEPELKAYISKAYIKIIRTNVTETLAEAYQLLDDRQYTRFIVSNLDLNIQMSDIKAYLD